MPSPALPTDQAPLASKITQPPLTALELFAGAGGLALGVKQAGFSCLGLIERDPAAVETLAANASSHLGIDAAKILAEDAATVDLTRFQGVDLLAGGPPCQPFSAGGKTRGPDDPRNMFPAFFRAVAYLLPQALLIENVKGLTRPKFSAYFGYILKQLEFPLHVPQRGGAWNVHYETLLALNPKDVPLDEQYEVSFQVIDAANFGVPQRRERIIITAFRRDIGLKPPSLATTHSRLALLEDQYGSGSYWTRHQIAFVPDHQTGKKIALEQAPNLRPWVTVRDALQGLPFPSARGMPEVDPQNHVQHPGARSYPGHTGSHYDWPAKALKAGAHGTPGGENTVQVCATTGEVRYLTIREAARLQTFPDDWRFQGSWGACIRQLGNAVPVLVARQFATELRKLLEKRSTITE